MYYYTGISTLHNNIIMQTSDIVSCESDNLGIIEALKLEELRVLATTPLLHLLLKQFNLQLSLKKTLSHAATTISNSCYNISS